MELVWDFRATGASRENGINFFPEVLLLPGRPERRGKEFLVLKETKQRIGRVVSTLLSSVSVSSTRSSSTAARSPTYGMEGSRPTVLRG